MAHETVVGIRYTVKGAAEVITKTQKMRNEFGQLGKQTTKYDAQGNKLSSTWSKQSSALKGLALRFVGLQTAVNLASQAIQQSIKFINESVQKFREFETRVAEISTILGDEAMPMIETLSAGIDVLSMKYGQASSDIAKGMYDILSAAFEAKDSINLLDTATKASIAGLSDVRTSVDIFTTVLNSYGMAAEQATNVSNILFQSVVRGKFQFKDLASALQYVVPIAAQAGIAFNDLMAALSTTTRHGLRLDMASRGLALAIQNIINPSEKASKAAEKYGVEMNGLAIRVLGLYGWFDELNEKVKEFGKSILGELIPNMRSLRVAMVLAGDEGISGFSDDLEKLANMGNATENALNKIMDTSQFVSNQMTQEFEKAKREIGGQWDELVLGIQRGVLGFVQLFTGRQYVSNFGAKYTYIPDDNMANAREYLRIIKDLGTVQDTNITREDELADLTKDLLYWQKKVDDQWFVGGKHITQAEKNVKSLKAEIAHVNRRIKEVGIDIEAGVETSLEFKDAFQGITGTIMDSIDALGDLELTLNEIELDIERINDEISKPVQYGWGDLAGTIDIGIKELTSLTAAQREEMGKTVTSIKGNLGYQYMLVKAEKEYADATHDVTMGLKLENYQYKALPDNIQGAVKTIREFSDAQDENRKSTERMTAAMRGLQIQTLEIQLKGMMRRRGLTRGEERRLKKIQIEQAKARIENMKGESKLTESMVGNYQTAQNTLDDYLLGIQEQQYQLKYSYDQQVIDMETLIYRETRTLQTRYDWWELTNNKIADTAIDLLGILNNLVGEDEFLDYLKSVGLEFDKLVKTVTSAKTTAVSKVGTYPTTPQDVTPEAPKPSHTWSGGRWIPNYQRGTNFVPRTGLVMAHKGETISPAGKNSGANVTVNIPVNIANVSSDVDMSRIAGQIGLAVKKELMNTDGTSKFSTR